MNKNKEGFNANLLINGICKRILKYLLGVVENSERNKNEN